jgi:membrane-bound serine protease (ClpP class)
MNSRRARRKPYVLCFLPIAISVIAFLLLSFALTAGSAFAATNSLHVMMLNSEINPASLLLDPNIIFLLFIIAMIGIFLEVSHPGAILPGVVGAIALLLFVFGAISLSPNWAGLVLMALAFVLLVLDIKLPAHGILTVGAAISLIIGALLFFNSGGPHQGSQVNPILVYAMGGLVGLVGLYVVTLIVRTRRRAVKTGAEGMIGAIVLTSTPLQPVGRVMFKGEDWTAILDDPSASVDPGTEVRVVAVEGLLLHVQPVVDRLSDSAPRYIQG